MTLILAFGSQLLASKFRLLVKEGTWLTLEEHWQLEARGNAHHWHAWPPPSHCGTPAGPGPKVHERPDGPVTGPAERVRCQLRGSIGHWCDRPTAR
jgi:hypothetical protein